ncbi:hypothetical protein DWG18_14250 [Lysobacter sp. TY2-98]|uniref:hypothetical protein n=1 Tax=Lysobacter sp. TY2-98 TaxID=2290922 RepID=UPI000E207A1B|nr:hypothetical protein [Lysobacter sp. TY2-98]AXK73323.1 hypothetical protein DWG18_14250 [Lysobacter sp. TY2-98]
MFQEFRVMQVMGATLRKITLKDGLTAMLFSLALTAGLAVAFKSSGRDMWQATDALMPVFIGGLAQAAGINPVRSPLLLALVAAGAAVAMLLTKLALGTL